MHSVLVRAFWEQGKINEAVEAATEMEQRGIVGAASVYYELACCLCNNGRWKDAMLQVCNKYLFENQFFVRYINLKKDLMIGHLHLENNCFYLYLCILKFQNRSISLLNIDLTTLPGPVFNPLSPAGQRRTKFCSSVIFYLDMKSKSLAWILHFVD